MDSSLSAHLSLLPSPFSQSPQVWCCWRQDIFVYLGTGRMACNIPFQKSWQHTSSTASVQMCKIHFIWAEQLWKACTQTNSQDYNTVPHFNVFLKKREAAFKCQRIKQGRSAFDRRQCTHSSAMLYKVNNKSVATLSFLFCLLFSL